MPDPKQSKSKQAKEAKDARSSMISKMTNASEGILPAATSSSTRSSQRMSLFGSPIRSSKKIVVDGSNGESSNVESFDADAFVDADDHHEENTGDRSGGDTCIDSDSGSKEAAQSRGQSAGQRYLISDM